MADESAELRRLRRKIDALDRRIVALLNERAELGRDVGREKVASGRRAIRDAERSGDEALRDRLVAERTELASKLHSRNPMDSQGRNHPAAS